MTETPDLKPASESPWYVLMTVAGAQTGSRVISWWTSGKPVRRNSWNSANAPASGGSSLSYDTVRSLLNEHGRLGNIAPSPLATAR